MTSRHERAREPQGLDRRAFLSHAGGGFGALALAHLLGTDASLADRAGDRTRRLHPEWNGGLHHRARATRVVQLFMSGAASQCDTFDFKPALRERNGQKFDPGGKVELFQSEPGAVMASPWKWRQFGQCGQWVSESAAALGDLRRRYRVPAGDGLEIERSWPRNLHAEYRLCSSRVPQHGSLDLVRPG